MLYKIKNFLYRKEQFWKLNSFFEDKLSFNIYKNFHKIRLNLKEEKIAASILGQSFWSLIYNMLYGAFFIFIFEILYRYFPYRLFSLPISDFNINDLISTIVTVSGVFLGLYFAAISTVAGGLFMRAPENLQNLFIRERKGHQYIKTLVLTTVIGIYYLLLETLGFKAGPLGPIVTTVLATYAVIRFMSLGFKTFYFIHPIEACATITSDAAQSIDNVTTSKIGWGKPFLQNHYRKQAEYSLEALQSLVNFGIEVLKLSEEQLVTIAKYCGGLLTYFLQRKKKIPTESYWFKDKPQFQKWAFADSSEIIIALNTGTMLSQKTTKDRTWFENQCAEIILKLFNYFISKKDWVSAHSCIEVMVSVSETLGEDFYDETAKLIVEKFDRAIMGVATKPKTELSDEDIKNIIPIVDSFGRLGVGDLIGVLRYTDKYSAALLKSDINEIKLLSKTSVYQSRLPGKILPTIESTSKQLKTEAELEGKTVSPDWYLTTLIVQEYLLELKKYYEFLKFVNDTVFRKNVERLIVDKKLLFAAHLIERWLEFINKYRAFYWQMKKLVEDCSQFKKVHDLPWVEINFQEEQKLIDGWDKEAVDKLVYLLPILAQQPQPPGDLPDHFGQAYTFGMMACYDACIDNDKERFKKIFPAIFVGSLAAYDSTIKQTVGWSQDSQVIFSSESLEDIMSLSGFAKIYSELYKNPEIWKVCEDAWNTYLTSRDAKEFITLLVSLANYRDQHFSIKPRAALRSNWDINLSRKLVELGLSSPSPSHHDRTSQVNHESPLVRLVAKDRDLIITNARAIFFATFLSELPAARDIEFPDRRGFKEMLERETANPHNEEYEDILG